MATSELAGRDAPPLRRRRPAAHRRAAQRPGVVRGRGWPRERRTERDLKQLDALLARREQAWESGDAEAFVDADATLHLAVVAASHNDVLTALYADLGEVLRDFLRADVGDGAAPRDVHGPRTAGRGDPRGRRGGGRRRGGAATRFLCRPDGSAASIRWLTHDRADLLPAAVGEP